ncbi:acyl-CoA acyltransferase [Bradyrhizobium iriomotense]|uniref:acyl-CoA acyltransferase n=1 Tax=Bradyrhizobium iriomotense TaxID=441950 RepID=UPI001B8A0BA1|nr:acyl-CoA acyltransferase [Bradyrhizobium iriomotense]MBR0784891.1 acyl-CoA acyltransferase [Bradyrhizobium iriomotense]
MIGCREIGTADLDAVADLLTKGFPIRARNYWIDGLRRLSARETPDSFPRFGYMLEHDQVPVGALLLIHTARNDGGRTSIRCNLSSWYVEPAFRSYAPMLTKIAQRHKDVTYVNISPAQWTWQVIEAQGFRCYCGGLFFSFPAISRPVRAMQVEVVGQRVQGIEGLPAADVALLARHAAYGCLCLVCRTGDGRAFPFVLQPMRVRRIRLPVMQLIYCADLADYVVCAGAIGRFLVRRGWMSIAFDANGPVTGLVGIYREPSGRKYFKGPHCPRLADLSDSELVIYGP